MAAGRAERLERKKVIVEGEELDAHYSASRRKTPPYRLCASPTIRLSLAVRRRSRTGDTTMT